MSMESKGYAPEIAPEKTQSISTAFNNLWPAEAERLAMLAEEAGEIVQIVGKILRHGYGSYHPANPDMDNREMLNRELLDLISVHILMMRQGDLPEIPTESIHSILQKKMRYAHHQEDSRL